MNPDTQDRNLAEAEEIVKRITPHEIVSMTTVMFVKKDIAKALAKREQETVNKFEKAFENSGCTNEACRHCEIWHESIKALKYPTRE